MRRKPCRIRGGPTRRPRAEACPRLYEQTQSGSESAVEVIESNNKYLSRTGGGGGRASSSHSKSFSAHHNYRIFSPLPSETGNGLKGCNLAEFEVSPGDSHVQRRVPARILYRVQRLHVLAPPLRAIKLNSKLIQTIMCDRPRVSSAYFESPRPESGLGCRHKSLKPFKLPKGVPPSAVLCRVQRLHVLAPPLQLPHKTAN